MIRKNQVYRKSAKGSEAISTRQHGLGPRQRSALIMVDGKRSADELCRMAQAQGDGEQMLQQLLDDGFIEEVGGTVAAVAAPPVVAAAGGPSSVAGVPSLTLAQAQRFAVRRLTDILGPSAESLCLRIESTRNAADLKAALARAESVVQDFRGAGVASQFAADMEAHQPSA